MNMALTEKDLRAIDQMLDEKFKLSETREAYNAMARIRNPNDPFTRKQLSAGHEMIMVEIKAIRYLLSEEFYSLPFIPS